VEAANLPGGRGDGQPMNTLVNCEGEDIVWMAMGDPNRSFVFHHSAGNGFVARLGDLVTKTKAGKDFMTVPEGARAAAPAPIALEKPEKGMLAALSSDARLLAFPLAEVPLRPNGGVGVQLIALPEGVTLASVAVTDGKSLVVSGVKRKNRATETLEAKMLKEYEGKRAQRGRVCDVGFRPDRLGG
jgi:topoisomerase-4 subunit A